MTLQVAMDNTKSSSGYFNGAHNKLNKDENNEKSEKTSAAVADETVLRRNKRRKPPNYYQSAEYAAILKNSDIPVKIITTPNLLVNESFNHTNNDDLIINESLPALNDLSLDSNNAYNKLDTITSVFHAVNSDTTQIQMKSDDVKINLIKHNEQKQQHRQQKLHSPK